MLQLRLLLQTSEATYFQSYYDRSRSLNLEKRLGLTLDFEDKDRIVDCHTKKETVSKPKGKKCDVHRNPNKRGLYGSAGLFPYRILWYGGYP